MSTEKETAKAEDIVDDLLDEIEEVEEPDTEETLEEPEEKETEEVEESDKQEEDEEDEESSEQKEEFESLVKSIAQQIGYDGEDEFEDTEEGIAQLTRKAAEKMAEDFLETKMHPEVKEFNEYIALGGNPDKYLSTKFPQTDYSKIEFDEENQMLQERLVKEDLVARGYEGEELEAELKDCKDGGILESKAKRALASLKERQSKEKESLLDRQKEEQKQAKEEAEKFWNTVNDKIKNSSEIKGLKLPETEKPKFYDFLTKPVKDGKTQRDLLLEDLTMEDNLAVDYLLYKGFDLKGLVDRKAKDNQAKSLRERLKQQQSKLNKKFTESKGTSSVEEVSDEI